MNKVVDGVGKDAPTVVNERGAKQSKVLYRFDLLDSKAMFEMTKVLKEGAEKYGADNWRGIPVHDHLNHLLIHAYAFLAGDTSDDHLSHIMCRAMFAQAVDIDDRNNSGIDTTNYSNVGNWKVANDLPIYSNLSSSFNIIRAIENTYGEEFFAGCETLEDKIAKLKDTMSNIKFSYPDAVDTDSPKEETSIDDGFVRCAMCRNRTIVKKEGNQQCSVCGVGHNIELVDGDWYIKPSVVSYGSTRS